MWQSPICVEMAQDVADDVCESWEDMIENGILEKKLEELQMRVPKNNSSSKDEEDDEDQVCTSISQSQNEDSMRTPYIPQVKILKRPNDAKVGPVGTSVEKSPIRQPMKSLQQREAEYAEARLRILGSASSEDESNQKTCLTSLPLGSLEKTEAVVNVIRLPHGPDGSKGFVQPR